MTDHYSDIREKHEEETLSRRASYAGRSIERQWFYEDVFLAAKKVHLEEKHRREMLKVYEDNKDEFE